MRLAEEYAGKINLLVTDVIMPEMDGHELAQRIAGLYPQIKHMFMSGYTADIITYRGMLGEGVRLLHKPFSRIDLAATVRKALDEEIETAGSDSSPPRPTWRPSESKAQGT